MTSINSSNSELENKLIRILSDVLEEPVSAIQQGASRESYSNWDSMKHIELVIAIEAEFGFRLKGEEVGKMNNLEQIQSLVQAKLTSPE